VCSSDLVVWESATDYVKKTVTQNQVQVPYYFTFSSTQYANESAGEARTTTYHYTFYPYDAEHPENTPDVHGVLVLDAANETRTAAGYALIWKSGDRNLGTPEIWGHNTGTNKIGALALGSGDGKVGKACCCGDAAPRYAAWQPSAAGVLQRGGLRHRQLQRHQPPAHLLEHHEE
jgi:hypothetical protein